MIGLDLGFTPNRLGRSTTIVGGTKKVEWIHQRNEQKSRFRLKTSLRSLTLFLRRTSCLLVFRRHRETLIGQEMTIADKIGKRMNGARRGVTEIATAIESERKKNGLETMVMTGLNVRLDRLVHIGIEKAMRGTPVTQTRAAGKKSHDNNIMVDTGDEDFFIFIAVKHIFILSPHVVLEPSNVHHCYSPSHWL